MKICILFPTETEASLFKTHANWSAAGHQVNHLVSGVGLTATAYATYKTILEQQADWLILAGIAGVYPAAQFKLNDVVLVQSEIEGDLGFFTPNGFVHMAHLPLDMAFERRHTLHCPHLACCQHEQGYQIEQQQPDSETLTTIFPLARSMSLNAAMANFVDVSQVEIENMEGAAFFHVCQKEKQGFLELRAISNVVQTEDQDWDMQSAVQALTNGLNKLIDHLLKTAESAVEQ